MGPDNCKSIGIVAKELSVSHRTIRFYEDLGFFQSLRDSNNRRFLDEAAVARIKQIALLQDIGLTLREITDVLRGLDPFDTPIPSRKFLLEQMQHLQGQHLRIGRKLGLLSKMLDDLDN